VRIAISPSRLRSVTALMAPIRASPMSVIVQTSVRDAIGNRRMAGGISNDRFDSAGRAL
jgi:hypothetical protein